MLQEEQLPIDRELGGAVLALLPSQWDAASLRAERQPGTDSSESYVLSIEPLAVGSGTVVPDEEVQLAVRKLFLLHRRYTTGLRSACYVFRRKPDGRWAFTADFQYDEE
ncbi:hypothetical protein [Pyxidicoccus sp. MSG2]|uniref:hypothetical protein n=1 Tax=Pyxidicoccus sp. MSG2 TaxID=2996790 RepID=UPI002272119B|nr:hypothetical protein [Pyxidicoccus sp. MSG2]MCY1016431.1 hypothetical protein [Pyxidicoccus sp. MSG2]